MRFLEFTGQRPPLDFWDHEARDLAPECRVGFDLQEIQKQVQVELRQRAIGHRRQPTPDSLGRVIRHALDVDGVRLGAGQLLRVLGRDVLFVCVGGQHAGGRLPQVFEPFHLADPALLRLLFRKLEETLLPVGFRHECLERLREPIGSAARVHDRPRHERRDRVIRDSVDDGLRELRLLGFRRTPVTNKGEQHLRRQP